MPGLRSINPSREEHSERQAAEAPAATKQPEVSGLHRLGYR